MLPPEMLPPETLKLNRDEVLTLAVKVVATSVRVFGSAARGDDREKSNQDLLSDRGGIGTPRLICS